MSDIELIREAIKNYYKGSQLTEALADLDCLHRGFENLHRFMNMAHNAGQFGDMGSFENWMTAAINAVKNERSLMDRIKKLDDENKELKKQRPIDDILERLTRLEKRMKLVKE